MAGAKEIRGKIASIKNTQKITKAMEMVAASKMRKAQDRMREARAKNAKIYVCAIGSKAVQFFRRLSGVELVASVTHLGDKPRVAELIGTTKVMLDSYRETKVDQLLLVHNVFVN